MRAQSSVIRGLRRSLGAVAVLAAVCLAGTADAAADKAGEGDLRGVWKPDHYIAAIRTTDGKLPPLLPKAAELYQSRVAARKSGGKLDDPLDSCLPAGTPRAMYQMRPFMLVQTPVKVTLVHEFEHLIRSVYLDEPLAWDETTWMGSSVGHWDRGTLVIETGGFNGKTWLDEAGLPLSEKLKVTERLRRTGKTTMEAAITIDDADNYSKAWTTKVTFQQVPGGELAWHVCTEKIFPMPPNARPKPPAN